MAVELYRQHLKGDTAPWASLPSCMGTAVVCHCKPQQQCHAGVPIEAVRERSRQTGPPSYLEQVASAKAQELFAGAVGLTAALENLNVATAEPFEKSGEDVSLGRHPEMGL